MIHSHTTTGLPVYASAADYPWDARRWPNFKPEELDCKGTGRIAIDTAALDALQRLRTRIGRPFVVVSAYRSPEHNLAVGGARGSKHMDGIAFDISLRGHDREELMAAAIEEGFRGIGRYPTFIHLDTRDRVARWGSW